MAKRMIKDKPLTAAERQARRREKLVTFRPADRAAVEAAAALAGKTVEQWVADVVAAVAASTVPPR